MRRFVALIVVAGSLVSSVARGSAPSPANCTLGDNLPIANRGFISLEGRNFSGLPDNCSDGLCGDYTVVIRDFAHNAIPGAQVVIDFSECCDMRIACDQLTTATDQYLLNPFAVGGVTNAAGRFTFKVQGAGPLSGMAIPGGTPLGTPCAKVYANGVLLGRLKVSAYDFNGDGHVDPDDFERFVLGLVLDPCYQRNDVNADGAVNFLDAVFMARVVTQAETPLGSVLTGPHCGVDSCPAPPPPNSAIQIDARALAPREIRVDGGDCVDAGEVQTPAPSYGHTIEPCNADCGAPVAINVCNGMVSYDAALEPALMGAGTGTLVLKSFPFPYLDDDNVISVGLFRIVVDPRWWSMMTGYPGFAVVKGLHRLVSPLLVDVYTRIGRSNPIRDGDPEDLAGTPVGSAGTIVADSMMAVVPPGFEGPAGSPEIHTEINRLFLYDYYNGSQVHVRAGTAAPDRPKSVGEIKPGTGAVGVFPAKSFFDVFVDVDLPMLGGNPGDVTLYNPDPLLVENDSLACLPPRVVYLHERIGPVAIHFRDDDATLPKRWLAGDRFGWLVLAGHGVQFDTLQASIDEFQAYMDQQQEVADTATLVVDVHDLITFSNPGDYVLPQYRDSLLNGVDQAAALGQAGDPCAGIRRLSGLLGRTDGMDTPPDWVTNLSLRASLAEKIAALAAELQAQANEIGGCQPSDAGPPTMPKVFAIQFVHPNPMAGSTTIGYGVPRRSRVALAVFDLGGRRVRTLLDEVQTAGIHRVTWDAARDEGGLVPSGIYFVRLIGAGVEDARRVVVVK